MNAYLHRSENRGHVQAGWLNTYHSFSFGSWYDPKYMGFGPLRVINDDTMGNEEHITAGEWQLMSAGTGVAHSEFNNSDEPVHLFQIWIHPNVRDAEPTYQQIKLDPSEQPNQWHLIAGPNDNAAMHIRQNAEVKAAVLEAGKTLEIAATQKHNYVHVIKGQIMIENQIVKAGDALLFDEKTTIHALEDSEMIWFDLPA